MGTRNRANRVWKPSLVVAAFSLESRSPPFVLTLDGNIGRSVTHSLETNGTLRARCKAINRVQVLPHGEMTAFHICACDSSTARGSTLYQFFSHLELGTLDINLSFEINPSPFSSNYFYHIVLSLLRTTMASKCSYSPSSLSQNEKDLPRARIPRCISRTRRLAFATNLTHHRVYIIVYYSFPVAHHPVFHASISLPAREDGPCATRPEIISREIHEREASSKGKRVAAIARGKSVYGPRRRILSHHPAIARRSEDARGSNGTNVRSIDPPSGGQRAVRIPPECVRHLHNTHENSTTQELTR